MAAQDASTTGSSHTIGIVPLLAFGVGTMVGGGVFTLSGTAVNMAGAGAILAYLIAAAVMTLCALAFVVIAARAKPGESGYGPVGDLLSPLWRFVVMWCFYLNGATIIAFLLLSFGDYLHGRWVTGIAPVALGIIAAIALAGLNLGPADLVARTETWVVGIKIAILVLFAAWGVAALRPAELTSGSPEGRSGIFSAAALLFTAYTGFNVITNMAGSVRNPRRTVPRAIMLTIAIATVVYLGVVVAMLASGIQHFGPAGVSEAAEVLMGPWGGSLVAFAACLSTLSGANANLLGASDIVLRLVARGDIAPTWGRTDRAGHPLASIGVLAVGTIVLMLVADTTFVVSISNVAAIVAMVVMSIAAAVLAVRGWPGEGGRLPGGPTIPVVAAAAAAAQLVSIDVLAIAVGLALIALGCLLYTLRRSDRGAHHRVHAQDRIDALDTPLLRGVRRRSSQAAPQGPEVHPGPIGG